MGFFWKKQEKPHLEVIPSTLTEHDDLLTAELGVYQGKPVVFTYVGKTQDIIIPSSLESIYPAIEEAVVRYLRQTGRM